MSECILLSELLSPARIALDVPNLNNIPAVFMVLGNLLGQSDQNLDPNILTQILLEREGLVPTAIGHGIAIPHARLPGLSHPLAAILRLKHPIRLAQSPDHRPIDLFFSFLTSTEYPEQHLQILAKLAKTFHNDRYTDQLRSASDSITMINDFKIWDSLDKNHHV